MNIKNKALLIKFETWMKELKQDDTIAILHHTDPDGVSSAVILSKTIEKIREKPVDIRLNQKSDELFITNATYLKLTHAKINKLIILDMSVDQAKNKVLEKIQQFAEILILDHHKVYRNVNSKKCLLIKPQMVFFGIDPASYCCSKFSYDLCNTIIDSTELDWIAALGVIGDCAFDAWKDFISTVCKKYGIPSQKNILKTKLGIITELLFFTEAYSTKKIGLCFDILSAAESYKDVLNSKLQRYQKYVKDEIKYWQSNVSRMANFYPKHDLIFDFIKPKYPIKAAISTIMSCKYPHKTVIIAQDMNQGTVHLSARRRDHKVAVNNLLERATRGLKDASGGGHITAAGGVLKAKDLFTFKENVLKLLCKQN